jgi:molybdenum cofactor guanylyltransferase
MNSLGGILLAGGQSRRMGRDKALLPWNGQPLIAHIADQMRPCVETLIVGANDAARYAFLGLRIVPDREPGQGPLMGLASCLAASRQELNLVVGCDMPWITPPLVAALLAQAADHDAVVPRSAAGPEPLCALYRQSCLPAAEALLARGARRLGDLLATVRVRWIAAEDLPGTQWQRNLNTPEDYQAACGATT